MSDIPDAIGSAMEGAALARAVEPRAGERGGKGHFHERNCLNCGAPLDGPYCKQCGQAAHLHRTLGAFLHDLSHGVLHFEGKTWRTLPMLVWKPGELTRRYIAGERARFVSPMAMFLFSVFVMFAVFQIAGISAPTDLGAPVQIGGDDNPAQKLANLRNARAQMGDANPATPLIDSQIVALEKEVGKKGAESAAPAQGHSPQASANGARRPKPGDTVVLAESADKKTRITGKYTGIAVFDHGVDKWRENPGLMAYKLQSTGYKFSWLLIPLSLPFVWLLFAWKRRFGLYDHAVFVTYSIAFMSLLFIVLTLLAALGVTGGWLLAAGTLIPTYHIYRQVRGGYELSRFSALWRTVALVGVVFVVLLLFFVVLLLLGAVE